MTTDEPKKPNDQVNKKENPELNLADAIQVNTTQNEQMDDQNPELKFTDAIQADTTQNKQINDQNPELKFTDAIQADTTQNKQINDQNPELKFADAIQVDTTQNEQMDDQNPELKFADAIQADTTQNKQMDDQNPELKFADAIQADTTQNKQMDDQNPELKFTDAIQADTTQNKQMDDQNPELKFADAIQVDTTQSEPMDETAILKQELEKTRNDHLYLKAEFDNFKRQSSKERFDLVKFGPERFIVEMLEVLDIFETALATEVTEENYTSFTNGIKMTSKQLSTVLEKFNVRALGQKGDMFDPRLHEALSSEVSEEVKPYTIIQVFKKGYSLHNKIIRPAQVIVAKAADKE